MTGEVLGRQFRRLGWDVLLSTTVEGGLSLLVMHPDCAILDLNLPDGDGDAVLAAIREAGLATRVVIASGTTDQRLLERVERLSPERLLRKPVVLEEVLQAFGVAG